MGLNVKNRESVVPGQELGSSDSIKVGDGVFERNGSIYSKFPGSVEVRDGEKIRVIPRKNAYVPREGDSVIGEIERVSVSSWNVDINCPYSAFMHVNEAVDEYVDHDEDISKWFDMGDLLVGRITRVTKGMDVKISLEDRNSRKLEDGRVITVAPSKVPRIIGRKGTMVNMIKDASDTMIIVGQNGRVWIEGENEELAARAVKKVAAEAHRNGLTETMESWLEEVN